MKRGALHMKLAGIKMDYLEQKALDAVKDVKQWRKIMRDTIGLLRKDLRAKLKRAKWCHKTRSVTGDGVMLVWQTRQYPHKPVSYHNQQTSIGYVKIFSTK